MTDRELRRLKRADLLELLIAQSKENEQLQNKLKELEQLLADRTIVMEKAGSIAEAALQLNGIFQTAEAAAQQYLENIQRLNEHQDEICKRKLLEAQRKADQIISAAEAHKANCQKEADGYWAKVYKQFEKLCEEREGLRELLRHEDKK